MRTDGHRRRRRRGRRGAALVLALVLLVASGLMAAGLAWRAAALESADRAAARTDAAWRAADLLLHATTRCGTSVGGTDVTSVGTEAGLALVRVHAVAGGCWVTVAVGDSAPLVGVLLRSSGGGVTSVATMSPSALPSLETASEIQPVDSTGSGGVTPAGRWSGPAWLDLR